MLSLTMTIAAGCDSTTGLELPRGSVSIQGAIARSNAGDTVSFAIANTGAIPVGFGCPYYLDRLQQASWTLVTDFIEQGCNAALLILNPGASFNLERVAPTSLPAGTYRVRFAELMDLANGVRGVAFPESMRVSNSFLIP